MKYKNVGIQGQERKTIYFPEVSARDFRTKTQAFHMWHSAKITKFGKPEFRTELRKMIQSKTSAATNEGIYKLENIQLLIAKKTPNASSSNSSSHKFNLHCSAGPNYPTAQNFTYEFTRIRLLTLNVSSRNLALPFFLCLAYSVRWVFPLIHTWRGVGSMRTLIHGSMCSKHRSSSTCDVVMVGSMCMCNHDVESTQEGCLHKCCSDMRWPGLFDEVRRASWRIYLSICKYCLHLRRMEHFLNLCKVRSLSINSPPFFLLQGQNFIILI